MKKTYLKPDTNLVILDACSICAGSPTFVWDVDKAHKEGDEGETPTTPDWGPIIVDKGEGNMGNYDPWNSSNW